MFAILRKSSLFLADSFLFWIKVLSCRKENVCINVISYVFLWHVKIVLLLLRFIYNRTAYTKLLACYLKYYLLKKKLGCIDYHNVLWLTQDIIILRYTFCTIIIWEKIRNYFLLFLHKCFKFIFTKYMQYRI